MNRCTILIASTVLAAGLASAQAIVEHAVAAAGGSAAGVAGKQVSNGIDKVFQKLDKTMKAAEAPAAPAKKQEKQQSAPQPVVAGPTTPPPYVRLPARKGPGPEPAEETMPAPVRSHVAAVPAGPPRPPLTSEALASVPIGTTKDELLARVGSPSARIVIPDGDRLVEVLSYSTRSQYIGSVRVDSGAVISVRVPQ